VPRPEADLVATLSCPPKASLPSLTGSTKGRSVWFTGALRPYAFAARAGLASGPLEGRDATAR
jgi:hypothetical protein